MENIPQLMRRISKEKKVLQSIIEKDYALSYLLAAIHSTDGLKENLVLKGGTALKKCYFNTYRFSEDLDYSTRVKEPIANIDLHISFVVERMKSLLNEKGPFQVFFERLVMRFPHPNEQHAYIIRVQFPEQGQALCRLKVEITVDEPIFTTTETRTVLHNFPEHLDCRIPVYSLIEITAEKLRALLQSKDRLLDRGWGATRVCRDYYDLWNLLQQTEIISTELIPLLSKKCSVRGVSFESPLDFIPENLITVAYSEWKQQILPFIPGSIPASELLPQVQKLILSIWNK